MACPDPVTLEGALEWMKVHRAVLEFRDDDELGVEMKMTVRASHVSPEPSASAFVDQIPRFCLELGLEKLIEHCEFLLE